MEFIIGVGVAIVSKLAEYTVVLARRLCHYTSDVDNLRAQVQQLNAERQELQGRVDEARGKGEVIHEEVQNWLTRAPGISQGAAGFLNNNRDRASISCCSVQIPNLVSRRKLSREARQMVEDLQREIEAAQRFGAVASRPALYTVIETRGDYEDFGSRKTILEGIMKALKDPNVSRIGVYGMGGSGKTMLAKEVARRATEAKLFTEVAMTTVSQTPDFSKIQTDVAEKIKLSLGEFHGVPARADQLQRQLQHELKERKNILIILDDIWEEINLIEVGIHLENEGCKILMTSRSQHVLGSMGTKQNFSVGVLPAEEAMNFFKTIVGDIIEQPNFGRLATDVVKECGGLPLAIRTVAYTLKNYPRSSVWKKALEQLQNSAPTIIDGMLKKVYPSIRLSYDFLESDDERSLLLLCSLFGEDRDIRVEDLMMCSVGLGMFADLPPLAHSVRMMVESLIIKLKARCLLLDGDGGDEVKLHDIIRDVALFIASEKGAMYSVILKKEDCPSLNMKKHRDSTVLSVLPHSDFNQLPERLECSELELFLLLSVRGNRIPIPISFFDDCKDRLKSLLFDRANLVTIPPSFHSLQNLQTLCLRGCVLEDVNFIGDLKNLQILDLSESTIKQLPIKLAQLSHLQMLNLEGCRDLKLIEPNVISSLKQSEELYISEYFDKWEVGEVNVSRRSNVNLAEIENLQQLTSLSLRVTDAKTFPKDFKFSEKLERYRISIGGPLSYSQSTRSLILKLRERSQLTALGLESLMKRSEELLLDGLIDVKNTIYDLDSEGFCDLKHLHLYNSDGVQYIVDCVDQQIHPHKVFPVLESLDLLVLRNLERICHGKLPEDSFKNLREVWVWSCDKLKNVFPLSIVKRLRSIQVGNCEMMEEIVGHVRSEDDGAVEFPELRYLYLTNLPKMVKFMSWSEAEAVGGSSSVESPDPLFGEKLEFPGLETLCLDGLNAVESVWSLQTTCYMVNLTRLSVQNCNSLKYLLSLAVAERLETLKELQVENCKVMEDIVVTKKLGEEGRSGNKILLPQLESLTLSKLPAFRKLCQEQVILPKLKSLSTDWSEAITEMLGISQSSSMLSLCHRQLKELNLNFRHQDEPFALSICKVLHGCHNLEKLQLNGFLVNVIHKDRQNEVDATAQNYQGQLITRLRELRLDNVPKLRHLSGEFVSIWQNLTILEVSFCHRLMHLLAFSTATSLVQLKQMRVTDCNRMTEIITDYRECEITKGEHDREFVFPQLEILVLRHLPNLGSFFSGNNVMRFPKLKKLFVSQCPEMRSFSHGIIISSSMLNTIITEINDDWFWRYTDHLMNSAKAVQEHWDGDVNTTVRQLREDDSDLALQQPFAETELEF